MASVLRFQDLTPSLTPPPSDRGDCEVTSMLEPDTYLPEIFYPSPAPSLTYQRSSLTPQSPEMGRCGSAYDAEEDIQQPFCFNPADNQIFPTTTTFSTGPIYSAAMTFQPYEQHSWMGFNAFPNGNLYPYPTEDSHNAYNTNFITQAPNSIVPPVPQCVTGASFNFNEPIATPQDSSNFLKTQSTSYIRQSRQTAPSITSDAGMSSRSSSPNSFSHEASESLNSRRPSFAPQRSISSSLNAYGIPIRSSDSTSVQAWRCAYPNCTSRAVFTRGCDLRKHYNRHSKHLFCRVDGCQQSEAVCIAAAQQQGIQAGADISDPSQLAVSGGFSSKKDRARHEAKHNPGIKCEWKGLHGEECGRVFSRMDNMKDHVRRIHNKGQPSVPKKRSSQ